MKRTTSANLYRFIRLVLGRKLSDREIARRWGLDIKSFIWIKQGRSHVPKIGRLYDLCNVLNVSEKYIWKVCTGESAMSVYKQLEGK